MFSYHVSSIFSALEQWSVSRTTAGKLWSSRDIGITLLYQGIIFLLLGWDIIISQLLGSMRAPLIYFTYTTICRLTGRSPSLVNVRYFIKVVGKDKRSCPRHCPALLLRQSFLLSCCSHVWGRTSVKLMSWIKPESSTDWSLWTN